MRARLGRRDGRVAARALHFVRAVRHAAEYAAEEPAGHARRRAQRADLRRLERRHIAVLALLAIELELISAIGREVFVVSGKGDRWHGRDRSTHSLLVASAAGGKHDA